MKLSRTARLNELGVEVTQKTIVGDDRERLAAAVRGALERVEIVIVTGGLGPTEDDVTREAVAQALQRRLVFSEEIRGWIEQRFARFGRPMAAINRRQAFLIEGAEQLENPNGTAPGQWIEDGGKVTVAKGGPLVVRATVGNLGDAKWLARAGDGQVGLSVGEGFLAIKADVPSKGSATIEGTILAKVDGPAELSFMLKALPDVVFGEPLRVQVDVK